MAGIMIDYYSRHFTEREPWLIQSKTGIWFGVWSTVLCDMKRWVFIFDPTWRSRTHPGHTICASCPNCYHEVRSTHTVHVTGSNYETETCSCSNMTMEVVVLRIWVKNLNGLHRALTAPQTSSTIQHRVESIPRRVELMITVKRE